MARYFSSVVILPDEMRMNDFVVEVTETSLSYYPFAGELHSTVYIPDGILLSYRADLSGETVCLDLLSWAIGDAADKLYAYSLSPCPSCMEGHFVLERLR